MISQLKSISIYFVSALLLIQSSVAFSGLTSSKINISSSFNPVGSGARALGMGSAFIAIADDATAASWNPSGLIQLRKPEFAVVGNFVHRQEDISFSSRPQANTNESVSYANLNYASASIPCGAQYCGKNMVFAINYQSLYNFDRAMKQDFSFTENNGGFQFSIDRKFNYQQSGDIGAIGLSYAIQATEYLSLGFTVNFWGNYLNPYGWKHQYETFDKTQTVFASGTILETTSNEFRTETNEFRGYNANIGAFWTVYEKNEQKIIIGAVVKTPFRADVKRTVDRTTQEAINGGDSQINHSHTTFDETYDMPLSYGFGISYQISDAFTIAGDVYRTEWGNFIRTAADGEKNIGIGFTPASESKVEGTTQVRLGAEYRIISQDFGVNYIIPIRTGFFYDPIPTNGPPDPVYVVSIGTGIAYEMFVFDIAYQYRFGFDLNSNEFSQDGFSMDLQEHTLYTSLFIRF